MVRTTTLGEAGLGVNLESCALDESLGFLKPQFLDINLQNCKMLHMRTDHGSASAPYLLSVISSYDTGQTSNHWPRMPIYPNL